MLKRRKFLIGGIIVVLAIGFLSYMGFMGAATFYYEVSELLEQGSLIYDENVRVNGQVATGSVEQLDLGTKTKFTLIDISGEETLPVVYVGIVPDTFKVGNEVVVEGYLDSDGTFHGHTLVPKCASRYVPA